MGSFSSAINLRLGFYSKWVSSEYFFGNNSDYASAQSGFFLSKRVFHSKFLQRFGLIFGGCTFSSNGLFTNFLFTKNIFLSSVRHRVKYNFSNRKNIIRRGGSKKFFNYKKKKQFANNFKKFNRFNKNFFLFLKNRKCFYSSKFIGLNTINRFNLQKLYFFCYSNNISNYFFYSSSLMIGKNCLECFVIFDVCKLRLKSYYSNLMCNAKKYIFGFNKLKNSKSTQINNSKLNYSVAFYYTSEVKKFNDFLSKFLPSIISVRNIKRFWARCVNVFTIPSFVSDDFNYRFIIRYFWLKGNFTNKNINLIKEIFKITPDSSSSSTGVSNLRNLLKIFFKDMGNPLFSKKISLIFKYFEIMADFQIDVHRRLLLYCFRYLYRFCPKFLFSFGRRRKKELNFSFVNSVLGFSFSDCFNMSAKTYFAFRNNFRVSRYRSTFWSYKRVQLLTSVSKFWTANSMKFSKDFFVNSTGRFQYVTSLAIGQSITGRLTKKEPLSVAIRATTKYVRRKKNIIGFRIDQSGRFTKRQRALFNTEQFGRVPLSSFLIPIDYDFSTAILKYSKVSIKSWLAFVPPFQFFQSKALMTSTSYFSFFNPFQAFGRYTLCVFKGYFKNRLWFHFDFCNINNKAFNFGPFKFSKFNFISAWDFFYFRAYRRFVKFFYRKFF